jgi:hypothetical protein
VSGVVDDEVVCYVGYLECFSPPGEEQGDVGVGVLVKSEGREEWGEWVEDDCFGLLAAEECCEPLASLICCEGKGGCLASQVDDTVDDPGASHPRSDDAFADFHVEVDDLSGDLLAWVLAEECPSVDKRRE